MNRAAKILRKLDALVEEMNALARDIDSEVLEQSTPSAEAYGNLLICRDKLASLRSRFRPGDIDELLADFVREGLG